MGFFDKAFKQTFRDVESFFGGGGGTTGGGGIPDLVDLGRAARDVYTVTQQKRGERAPPQAQITTHPEEPRRGRRLLGLRAMARRRLAAWRGGTLLTRPLGGGKTLLGQ